MSMDDLMGAPEPTSEHLDDILGDTPPEPKKKRGRRGIVYFVLILLLCLPLVFIGFYAVTATMMLNNIKRDPAAMPTETDRPPVSSYAYQNIVLMGSEVKSLRQGGANIGESYASVEGGELWLINGYIAPYAQAKTWGHEERRKRKLLVSKKERARLWAATAKEGMTLVPLAMYFNDRGIVKLKLGIAKGKKLADKRETSAKRDWDRYRALFLDGARLSVAMDSSIGSGIMGMDSEELITQTESAYAATGFHEIPLVTKVEQHGLLASVMSSFEIRLRPTPTIAEEASENWPAMLPMRFHAEVSTM